MDAVWNCLVIAVSTPPFAAAHLAGWVWGCLVVGWRDGVRGAKRELQ